jgi:uroporphyrinogen-III decarboxylase
MMLMSYAMGPVREAIDTLLRAADALKAGMGPEMMAAMQIQSQWGAPSTMGSFSKAPFDIIGDTMRGTKGIMLDMYRCPDKLIAACDAVIPSSIRIGVSGAMMSGNPFIMIPLHKGADSFMSEDQFARFYWPSFKRQLEGLIQAGLIPCPFVEGGYNNRLDIIADSNLPKGKIVWGFDQTDMKTANKKLGGKACIGGNVPSSLFATGTPKAMEECCKTLIETCAPDGGYYLAPGAVINNAKPENIHAFINSTKKYRES